MGNFYVGFQLVRITDALPAKCPTHRHVLQACTHLVTGFGKVVADLSRLGFTVGQQEYSKPVVEPFKGSICKI
jgi:hypothetical protein